ncbi:DUF1722 domain-containing protein [Bacillus alkalicellulosilyticus]|uniref:DUF1722 domain-containing protein n=1 Tax=Alkalihalobacterium alkalicellulosilyticum TaxID=1912214 RepID=UPI0014837771|nr:DUF1722 domain-containing protein [Bacillus alkalicellulosilyticus]
MEKIENIKFARKILEKLWAQNKYDVMSKGYEQYVTLRNQYRELPELLIFDGLYDTFSTIMSKPYKRTGMLTTLEHVWGYFKREATEEEKQLFFEKLHFCKALPDEFREFPKELLDILQLVERLKDTYKKPYIQQSTLLTRGKWNEIMVKGRRYYFVDGELYVQ